MFYNILQSYPYFLIATLKKTRRLKARKSSQRVLDQTKREYIRAQRNGRITATEKKVKSKANFLFTKLYPNTEHKFKASKAWFTRMSHRNNLVQRRVTNVGQKIPKNAVEIAEEFIHDIKTVVNFQTSQRWMKLRVTLIFLVPQPLTKNNYRQSKSRPQVPNVFVSPQV